MPNGKMIYLGSANGVQDSQDKPTGCPWDEGAVKARATLLNGRKVKCRRVSDCLHVVRNGKVWGSVAVVHGNGLPIHDGNRSREGVTKIRIVSTPVPSIPTRVYVQLRQVRKPFSDFRFIDACRGTTLQMAKSV